MSARWEPTLDGRSQRPAVNPRERPQLVPDPKPPARIVNDQAGRRKVKREGRCRSCKRGALVVQLERHHLVYRSHGGDDVDECLVPLCTFCHHVYTTMRGRPEWRRVAVAIRRTLTLAELRYVVTKKSAAYLDDHYPSR